MYVYIIFYYLMLYIFPYRPICYHILHIYSHFVLYVTISRIYIPISSYMLPYLTYIFSYRPISYHILHIYSHFVLYVTISHIYIPISSYMLPYLTYILSYLSISFHFFPYFPSVSISFRSF